MFSNGFTIATLLGILGWLIAIAMLFVVPVNRKPSSATAWLLLIFILPYFGLILFLLLGSPKLPKRRRAEQHNMSQQISKAFAEAKAQPELAPTFILNLEVTLVCCAPSVVADLREVEAVDLSSPTR